MAGAEVSPKGGFIAVLQPGQGRRVGVIYPLGGGDSTVIRAPENARIIDIDWGSENALLVTISQTESMPTSKGLKTYDFHRMLTVDPDNGETHWMMRGDRSIAYNTKLTDIVALMPDDPEHILMQAPWYDVATRRQFTRVKKSTGEFVLTTQRVDLENGRSRRMEQGDKDTINFITDASGDLLARVDHDARQESYQILAPDGHGWRAVYSDDDASVSPFIQIAPSIQPGALTVLGWHDGQRRLLTIELQSGAASPLPGTPAGVDINRMIVDPFTNRMIGYEYIDDGHEEVFLDERLKGVAASLRQALPGQTVHITSWNRARTMFSLTTTGPENPGTLYLYDAEDQTLSPLGEFYPGLEKSDIGQVQTISYQAPDGLPIEAFLTLPPGTTKEDGPFPFVILPHGGPEARDWNGFHWMAQFIASRGYAVLQPNFRGSSGYGRAFRDAGFGEFGGKMIDDIAAGLDTLIETGVADPERVCTAGASYGGYAALMTALRRPDKVDCVISINGLADPGEVFAQSLETGGRHSRVLSYWSRYIGSRFDEARMREMSPVARADEIRAPVLLLHGEEDTIVPLSQAVRMQNVLEQAGEDVRLVSLPGENHHLHNASSRLTILREMESFLARHAGE